MRMHWFTLLGAVAAVFQDEAGKTDIHFPLLGCPSKVFFHSPVAGQGSLCYALTDRNILAALSCRSGDIIWRQIAPFETSFSSFKTAGEVLVTLGDDGSVTGWSSQDGAVLWRAALQGSTEGASLSISFDGENALVATREAVTALRLSDGGEAWQTLVPDLKAAEKILISDDENGVFVVSASKHSSGLSIEHLDHASGASRHRSAISTDTGFEAEDIHVSDTAGCPAVIYKGSTKNDIVVKLLNTGATAVLKTELSYEKFSAHMECLKGKVIVLISFHGTGGRTWAEVYTVSLSSTTGTVETTYHIPAVTISSAFTLTSRESNVYVVRTTLDINTSKVEVWSSEGHGRLVQHEIPLDGVPLGHIRSVSAEVSLIGESQEAMARVMLSTDSCGFYMLRGPELDWQRPEGLSKVHKIMLINLPERAGIEVMSESSGNVFTNFASRLRRHSSKLISLLDGTSLTGYTSDDSSVRDHFGLRQYAIASSDDEIWAVDTLGDKKVVWSRNLNQAGISLIDTWQKEEASHEVAISPIIVLLAKTKSGIFELELDALSGATLSSRESESRPNAARSTRTVSIDIHVDTIEAHVSSSVDTFSWEFRLPPGNHVIAKALSNDQEQVASVGRVLGDRGVLYKHLGQIVAIVSVNELTGSLSAFLLAAEDGRIIHQATYLNVGINKPVHVVASENWFAYHFWTGGETSAYQMVITELYQGQRNTRALSSKGEVHAISQNFIYDYELTAMTVTTSKQGITSRDIVVALKNGQITTISRRLLDPRRPTEEKLSAADKEEMLIPYHAVIEIEPKTVLSHNLQVLGIDKIIAGATLLESTGLICAYGLDLFITRATPSMPFDILSDSFSKAQIILSLSLLLVAIIITRPMAARKTLQRRWIG